MFYFNFCKCSSLHLVQPVTPLLTDTQYNPYLLHNMDMHIKQRFYVIYNSLYPCFIDLVIVFTSDFGRVTKFCFFVQTNCVSLSHRFVIRAIIFIYWILSMRVQLNFFIVSRYT